jgi:hypothetical protein
LLRNFAELFYLISHRRLLENGIKSATRATLLHPTRGASRFWRVGNDLGEITAGQIALHKQRKYKRPGDLAPNGRV